MNSVLLGAVVDVVMGQAPPGDACNKAGEGVPFVKAGEFADRRPVIREWTTKPLRLAQYDDTLVCVVGATAGKVNQGADCAIGRSVAAVRPRLEHIDPSFLYRFLSTTVGRLRGDSQGAAQGVITRDMITSLELLLPSLPEQRRIAAILDHADALRAKRCLVLTHLDSLPQAIFHAMFGSHEFPTKRLADIVDIRSSLVMPDPTTMGDMPHVGPDSIQSGRGAIAGWRTVGEDGVTSGKYRFLEGDVLYSKIRPNLNKVATARFAGLCSADMYALVPRSSIATATYVEHTLRSAAFLAYASSVSNRANIPKLNRKQLQAYQAPLPPLAAQREFDAAVGSIARQRDKAERCALVEDELFASLQSRAFRGEL